MAPQARAPATARRTRVAVVEEHDILRYGLVACLAEDRRLEVIAADSADALAGLDVDIAIVSSRSAQRERFPCPIIVYGETAAHGRGDADGNDIAGLLHPASLTLPQLHATVHAAAAGLRIEGPTAEPAPEPPLDARAIQLIEYLADGHTTREIAEHMNYSERTIKKLITALQDRLDARSRAQIVAQAIRRGLI